MSQEPRPAPAPQKQPNPNGAHDGGGNGWKWLAGAAAAAVLLGGGYYAYKSMGPGEGETQTAAYDSESYGAGPLEAEPLRGDLDDTAQPAAVDERPARTTERANRPAPQRQAAAIPRDEPAEQVIGVGPSTATFDQASLTGEDEIIVEGRRLPVWSRTPNGQRLAAVYPQHARELGRGGEASVSCTVQEGGSLDCVRVAETEPAFGRAALRAASMFRHAPQRADGSSAVGTPVNLRMLFRLEDGPNHGSRL